MCEEDGRATPGRLSIDQITRTLNREGFTQAKLKGNAEPVTERIVLRYLDSNGVEKALKTAVGVKNQKRRPVEEFLRSHLKRTNKPEDRALNKDVRAAYVEWAKGKNVEIENATNLGKLITKMGFERGKDGKGNRYYRGCQLKAALASALKISREVCPFSWGRFSLLGASPANQNFRVVCPMVTGGRGANGHKALVF